MEGMQLFLSDMALLVARIYDTIDTNEGMRLLRSQYEHLHEAAIRTVSASDREIVQQLVQRTFHSEVAKSNCVGSDTCKGDLLQAIDANDSALVESLLDEGTSANHTSFLDCSPLALSARQGRLRISEILLSRGADPNIMTTRLPQHSAAEGGHTKTLRLLLSQKGVNASAVDSFGRTALHYASGSGKSSTVQVLLDLEGITVDSVDEDGLTPLFHAVARAYSTPTGEPGLKLTLQETEIVRRLLAIPAVNPNRRHPGHGKRSLLCLSIMKENMTMVEMLLNTPDIDIHESRSFRSSPTFTAILSSNEQMYQLLTQKGAKCSVWDNDFLARAYRTRRFSAKGFLGGEFLLVHTLSRHEVDVDESDELGLHERWRVARGKTALIEAAEKGHTGVVRILLKHNASVLMTDNERGTALSWAAACGHSDAAELLLQAKSDVNHQDEKGWTPLTLAIANLVCDSGHIGVIRMLLKHKASVFETDNKGRTALSWAAAGGHSDVADLLLQVKSDVDHQDTKGRTPLALAIANLVCDQEDKEKKDRFQQYENMVRTLLKHGANPNPTGSMAHWAQCLGNFKKILEGDNRKPEQATTSESNPSLGADPPGPPNPPPAPPAPPSAPPGSISLAQLFTLSEAKDVTLFDVTELPRDFVLKTTVPLLRHIDQSAVDAAINTVRSRFSTLKEQEAAQAQMHHPPSAQRKQEATQPQMPPQPIREDTKGHKPDFNPFSRFMEETPLAITNPATKNPEGTSGKEADRIDANPHPAQEPLDSGKNQKFPEKPKHSLKKPAAPVRHLDLEDEFSAKMKI
ncbi:MAG: hypothetical protein Q9168_003575 [Polycauliona sp. 1 TL-2023]